MVCDDFEPSPSIQIPLFTFSLDLSFHFMTRRHLDNHYLTQTAAPT